MCLAIPAQVVSIEGNTATVDFGGVKRSVSIALVEKIEPGDYVIVHTGYAIQKMDQKEAEESLELWREILAGESAPES
ncbi:MAG: HypC/HybG/HupF family hydrogenase formation chaperone [Candidatus Odinarchaeota archaeon]